MPICYQLVGVPGSGKTTWVNNQNWLKDFALISTDNIIDRYARTQGKTYTEVFDVLMPRAIEFMARQVNKAKVKGQNIIWDQTSTTVASRQRKFRMLPDYDHIAVVFSTPPEVELRRRLESRPGKVIPQRVIIQMIENFESPSCNEGFNEIWYVT